MILRVNVSTIRRHSLFSSWLLISLWRFLEIIEIVLELLVILLLHPDEILMNSLSSIWTQARLLSRLFRVMLVISIILVKLVFLVNGLVIHPLLSLLEVSLRSVLRSIMRKLNITSLGWICGAQLICAFLGSARDEFLIVEEKRISVLLVHGLSFSTWYLTREGLRIESRLLIPILALLDQLGRDHFTEVVYLKVILELDHLSGWESGHFILLKTLVNESLQNGINLRRIFF